MIRRRMIKMISMSRRKRRRGFVMLFFFSTQDEGFVNQCVVWCHMVDNKHVSVFYIIMREL